MTNEKLFRLGGLAAITNGCLSQAAAIIGLISTYFLPSITEFTYASIFFIGSMFEIFAFMGIYARQAEQSGYTGLAGFSMTIVGNIIIISQFFPMPGGLICGGVIYLGGLLLLAVVTKRVNILPCWGIWLILLGSLASLAANFLGEPILFLGVGPILFNIGMIRMGIALWSGKKKE